MSNRLKNNNFCSCPRNTTALFTSQSAITYWGQPRLSNLANSIWASQSPDLACQVRNGCWKGGMKQEGEQGREREGDRGQGMWTATSGLAAETAQSVSGSDRHSCLLSGGNIWSQIISFPPSPPPPFSLLLSLLRIETRVQSQCVLLTWDWPLTASFTAHFLSSFFFCYSTPHAHHPPPTAFIHSNVR